MSSQLLNSWLMIIFVIGYMGIILESVLKLNKTGIALLLGAVCWLFFFINPSFTHTQHVTKLGEHLSEISQILFFLLGAMTVVELIDSHRGFNSILRFITTRSKWKVLWLIAFLSFFLSAILDNLTTSILMISILRKLVPLRKERILISCMVVIAANAGGAWTPIGDVTTTMLWINGQISTLVVVRQLFLPSFICMLVPLICYTFCLRGNFEDLLINYSEEPSEPGGTLVFILGLCALLAVPLIKWLTGLPPFMAVLIGLAVLWICTDILHQRHEHRQHLRIPHILTKVDVSNILFFLGILLAIDALESVGILSMLADHLDHYFSSVTGIATSIGLLSAVVDNVPLVAATMGMYDLAAYPMDSRIWILIAYTAGTGGSILIIGSAAGVAIMGMEKLDFITYAKKAFFPALLGFAAGIGCFLLLF